MLTNEQRIKRKHYLGASDISVVVNRNPWEDSTTLKLSKIYEHIDLDSVVVEMGNRYEGVILQGFEQRMDIKLITDPDKLEIIRDDLFCVHPDSIWTKGKMQVPVEAKKTDMWQEWGEDEFTDVVPEHYLIQLMMQMYALGADHGYIVVLMPWYNRLNERIYFIERNEELIAFLVDSCREWWQKYIIEGQSTPIEVPRQAEIINRVERIPDSLVRLDPELYNLWQKEKTLLDEAKKKFEQVDNALKIALADAECGELPDGGLITYMEGKAGEQIDSRKLRAHDPALYNQFKKPRKGGRRINYVSAEQRHRKFRGVS